MKYNNIYAAKFINRPNRFIANVYINGKEEVCHVKNTGRCKELLISGVTVYLEKSDNQNRKTLYDLVAVEKGDRLINIDSQAPNKVVYEYIKSGKLFDNVDFIKPEYKFGGSRLDFMVKADGKDILIEVKGVTLEENGVVMFPDAPTERGIRHIEELITAIDKYDCYIIFVIQMKNVKFFMPNYKMHQAFADILKVADDKGVHVLAIDSIVDKNSLVLSDMVEVRYEEYL